VKPSHRVAAQAAAVDELQMVYAVYDYFRLFNPLGKLLFHFCTTPSRFDDTVMD
jgi:hypothetical protein